MQFPATTAQVLCRPHFGNYTFPPFKFQPRHENMNWRRIHALDVDRVTRELDLAALQETLADVTFCNLDQEACVHCGQPLDPALLKVLRLAQLTIEYLLHCQDHLSATVAQLEARLQASQGQLEARQQELGRQAEQLKSMREKSHQRRNMINTLQQHLLRTGGQRCHMCHLCDKTFLNANYLWNHFQRRHQSMTEGDEQKKQGQRVEKVLEELQTKFKSTQGELEALKEWQQQQLQALQSQSVMRSNLGSLQDEAGEEQPRQTQELRALMQKMETQGREQKRKINELQKQLAAAREVQAEKEGLQEEIRRLQEDMKRLQASQTLDVWSAASESQRLIGALSTQLQQQAGLITSQEEMGREQKRKINELQKQLAAAREVQAEKEGLQEEIRRLQEDMKRLQASQTLDVWSAASESQRLIGALSTQLQQQAGLIASQGEMMQTLSPRKVEEPEDSGDEKKVLESLRQNPTLLKQTRQVLEDILQERLESLGIKKDAKGIPAKTLQCLQQNRREGKFPEYVNLREKLPEKSTRGEEEGQKNEAPVSLPDSKASVKTQQSLLVTAIKVQSKTGTLHEALPSKPAEPEPPMPVLESCGSHSPDPAQEPTLTATSIVYGPFSTPASPVPGLSSAEDSKKDSGPRASPQPSRVPSRVVPWPEDHRAWSDSETLEGSSQAPDQCSETPVQVIGKNSRERLEDPEKKPAEGVNVLTASARPQQAALGERELQLSDDGSDVEEIFLQDDSWDLRQREKSQPPEMSEVRNWIPGQVKICHW